MKIYIFRIKPGNDLKTELEKLVKTNNVQAKPHPANPPRTAKNHPDAKSHPSPYHARACIRHSLLATPSTAST
jgi:hypothetical protein